MGPKRDTRQGAAIAARRSAEAPASKPARPTPRKPTPRKPTPPVTDCAKCSKLAALKRENTRLSREIERLVAMDRARVQQALAGGPVCISDAEVAEVMQRVYAPAFEQVVRVPVDIALSCEAEDGDRLRASQIVVERIAGKVPDKLQHSGSIAVTDLSDADLTAKIKALLGVVVELPE